VKGEGRKRKGVNKYKNNAKKSFLMNIGILQEREICNFSQREGRNVVFKPILDPWSGK
jgi:hypothetical protein